MTTSRRRAKRLVGVAMPVVLSALLLAGCGGGSSGTQNTGYDRGAGIVEQIDAGDRESLEPITGRLLDGGQYDSRDHIGEVVVYNVWGSWCGPCRKEAPELRKVWQETRAKGVQFVGLDVKDNDTAALAFERRYKIGYPSITSKDSSTALLAFGTRLPPNAVPSTMIVDQEGRLAARIIGPTTATTLRELVAAALAETTTTRKENQG